MISLRISCPVPREIEYSTGAIADLSAFEEYTIMNWGTKQAEKYVLELQSKINDIANGKVVARLYAGASRRLNFVSCNHHKIFYEIRGDVLIIIAIFHEPVDLVRHLHDRKA